MRVSCLQLARQPLEAVIKTRTQLLMDVLATSHAVIVGMVLVLLILLIVLLAMILPLSLLLFMMMELDIALINALEVINVVTINSATLILNQSSEVFVNLARMNTTSWMKDVFLKHTPQMAFMNAECNATIQIFLLPLKKIQAQL